MDGLVSESVIDGGRARHWIFVLAILAGSFLLFLVQPMVARMALPRLGGAPAVWNSAMLVYQALLLGGYAYAHWLGRLGVRAQALVHLGVLAIAALWLPIGLIASEPPVNADPTIWVPWLLCASIGPLFFAIAAQAPLLQRWYSAASGGRDPYALYAASNIGSFAGLIAYPLLVEPEMALKAQSWLWTAGYALVFLLIAACATLLPRTAMLAPAVRATSPAPGRGRVVHWILLAFVPSGLMLATTTFLTTDIVAVPMLWVLPLGLYLLSFSVAFRESATMADLLARCIPAMLLLFGAAMISGRHEFAYLNAIIGLVLLFAVAVALHSCMYQLRPAPDRLTGFYLAMAVGGVLGGVFSALVAPILFDWTYEYPLLILAAGALGLQRYLFPFAARIWEGPGPRYAVRVAILALMVALIAYFGIVNPGDVLGAAHEQIAFFAAAVLGLLAIGARAAFLVALAGALYIFGGYRAIETSFTGDRTRSYFGVYTVSEDANEHRLAHGTTLHGVQLTGIRSRMPTTYYVPGSGIGQAMAALPALYGPNARVGIVGLGTGTLACYARAGQHWRFFEIDPAVVGIARDSGRFTFLRQCLPSPEIALGDARLRLAESAPASLDLLALDAFSSDAVPMHLMTREAFQTYARTLAPNGLLLVHISNRFLALAPVVAAAAEQGGWHAMRMVYSPSDAERADEATISDWIALSRDPSVLAQLTAGNSNWTPLVAKPGFRGWSDDYASVVPVMRAFNPSLKGD